MPETYNSDPNVLILSEILNSSTGGDKLRAEMVSKHFELASRNSNCLEMFTSDVDPKQMTNGGARTIFARKNDLSKGGGQTVHFGTISTPAGRGARGDEELTGRTSKSSFGSYKAVVDWVRDAVEWNLDDEAHISAGQSLERVTVQLLADKMGIVKENSMLKRLIDSSLAAAGTMGVDAGNVYRPNNKMSVDALEPEDTLSTDVSDIAAARLGTIGGKPLSRTKAANGSPVDGYMLFGTQYAMLGIRGDSAFQTAISHADERGSNNANFTGELMSWKGNSFYEQKVVDMDWDDFIGNALIPKAVVTVAVGPNTANTKLIVNADNTDNQYFQWFGGKAYTHNRVEALIVDSKTYYGWAINPDGSRVFFSYAASGNNGNQITITNILSPAATGALDATTVGALTTGTNALDPDATTAADEFLGGGDSTLPASGAAGVWKYSNTIDVGAVIIQANRLGTPYSRSFMFATMAGCFASGSVNMSPIEQTRDFGFIKAKGFHMIYGTGVPKNTKNQINGYVLIEHAIEHPGYPVPSYTDNS